MELTRISQRFYVKFIGSQSLLACSSSRDVMSLSHPKECNMLLFEGFNDIEFPRYRETASGVGPREVSDISRKTIKLFFENRAILTFLRAKRAFF
jgi:hypothetical protein